MGGLNKEKIIEVSATLFNDKSYSATSIQDIAEALGVTKAALYYYISSKEEILFEIFNQTMTTAESRLNSLLSQNLTVEQLVKKIIYNHIMAVFDEAPNISIFFTEKAHLPVRYHKEINKRRREYEEKIAEVLRKGVQEDVLKKDIEILPTVYAILGMCNWLYHWYDPNGRLKPEELSKLYADIVLDGIRYS